MKQTTLKAVLSILIFILIGAFFVVPSAFALSPLQESAPPPVIQDFNVLNQLVIIAVTIVVTFGLQFSLQQWGIDLNGKGTQFVATLTLLVQEFINGVFVQAPPEYYPLITAGLQFLTVAFLTFGGASLLKKYTGLKIGKGK